MVVGLGEFAGGPSRGFENGGSTEPPMSDEGGADGLLSACLHGGLGDGEARELMEGRVVNLEGEEGGDGGSEVVFCFASNDSGVVTAEPASGDEYFVGREGFSFRIVNEVTFGAWFESGDSMASAPLDAEVVSSIGEAVDDGFRGVGGREHAAIGFGLEGDAFLGEPGDGINGIEAREGAAQGAVTARVVFDQFTRFEAIVSDVATPSARDADFGEDFFRFFENENAFEAVFRSGDGSEESGRSASDDDQLVVVFGHRRSYSLNTMELQEAIEWCLALPQVEETTPFGPDVLVYKVAGKMFATAGLEDGVGRMNLKCDPEQALELREEWEAIIPGYHMNKKHWNTVIFDGSLRSKLVGELIEQSYDLVVAGMPKKLRGTIPSRK